MKSLLQQFLSTVCFVLVNTILLYSQDFCNAKNTGMAEINTTSRDVWSVNNNQASLAYLQDKTIGISYNNHFLLKELSTKNISLVTPFKFASLGLSVSNFGYSSFSVTRYSIACGKKLYSNIAAGIRVGIVNLSQGEEYGSVNRFTFSTGVLYQINDHTELGIIINNPFYKSNAEHIDNDHQTSYKLGIKHKLSDKVNFYLQTDKCTSEPVKFKIGTEFNNNKFIFNCGASTSPYEFSFGTGLYYRDLLIFLANQYNQYLGFSPAASIQYTF